MKKRIIFRADGGPKMGLGHVYRCLAIAEVLNQAFNCQFVTRQPLAKVMDRITHACTTSHILPDSLALEEEASYLARTLCPEDIVVLDGYHFETAYQERVKSSGAYLVCIDDIFAYHFIADVVINTAGGVRESFYTAAPHTRFFLGPRYALLHPAFNRQTKRDQTLAKAQQTFICLGGADPNNDTLQVLKKCENLPSVQECHLVTGAAYQYLSELKSFLKDTRLKVKHHRHLSPEAMAQLMGQCARAICTPSSISYEYLSIGGELYLHPIADNQAHIFDYLIKNKMAFRFDQFPVNSITLRTKAREKQKEIFNGQSAHNILQLFKSLDYALPQSAH